MPHLMIDYSANMEDRTDMQGLCDVLRLAAIETGVFPLPGVRVRAMRADFVSIADGDPRHGYVDISVRPARAIQALFLAAERHLQPAMDRFPIALSLEMRDIDPDLSPKTGTIRDHLG